MCIYARFPSATAASEGLSKGGMWGDLKFSVNVYYIALFMLQLYEVEREPAIHGSSVEAAVQHLCQCFKLRMDILYGIERMWFVFNERSSASNWEYTSYACA